MISWAVILASGTCHDVFFLARSQHIMERFITRLNEIEWENISKDDINNLIAEFDAVTPCTSLSAGFELLLQTQSRYSQTGQKRKADYVILIILAIADVELRLRDRSETETRSMICNAIHRSLELNGRERTLSEEAIAVRQATRLLCYLEDKLQASFLQTRAFEIPFHGMWTFGPLNSVS